MESKNTSQIGLRAEERVRLDLLNRGYQILGQRLKTPFAEIDLLVRTPRKHLVILEVKSLSRIDWIESRLGLKQAQRLHRAAEYLTRETGEGVALYMAYVLETKIHYVPMS